MFSFHQILPHAKLVKYRVFLMSDGRMEQSLSAVMLVLLCSVVVKKELRKKAELLTYWPVYSSRFPEGTTLFIYIYSSLLHLLCLSLMDIKLFAWFEIFNFDKNIFGENVFKIYMGKTLL